MSARVNDRLSVPPGPDRKKESYSAKIDYPDKVRKAFQEMKQPYFLTMSGSRNMNTTEWLILIESALSVVSGLDIQVDVHKQQRDRSIHIAIYGLPKEREREVYKSLYSLRKQVRGKKEHFLIEGCSLSYIYSHSDFGTIKVIT